MKHIKLYIQCIVVIMLAFACWGCNKSFLRPTATTDLNEQSVFSDSLRTTEFLSGIYSRLTFYMDGNITANVVGGLLSETTDESETRWPGAHNVPNQIFGGTFGTAFYNKTMYEWTYLYTGIRQVNILLENLPRAPLSTQLKHRMALEARFLRAYFYHWMMRYWGGIILVGDEVYGLDALNESVRSPYADCVEYVVGELEAIALELPLSYSGIDYGRVTRGAALALRSRVLLQAASPLFNGGSFATKPEVIPLTAYPTADAARWERALRAAQDVVDLGVYSLYTDNETRPGNGFYQVFLERVNNEFILQMMLGPNKLIEAGTNPPSRGGNFRRYPSQQLVDAFPMSNGKPIGDQTSGYDEDRMYENRDPRFYYTIIYNGAPYYDQRVQRTTPVYTYVGADRDGLKPASNNTGTSTGYYARKGADENLSNGAPGNTLRCPPILRYAEVLLNLAEAANEAGETARAMDQLIELRKRAGIEPGTDNRYGIPVSPTPAEARELIRNERFIELAFEEHRYWDIRRWRIGKQYEDFSIEGIRITRNNDDTFTSERFDVRAPRYFGVNSYLFPIPETEIAVNRKMLQNPGW